MAATGSHIARSHSFQARTSPATGFRWLKLKSGGEADSPSNAPAGMLPQRTPSQVAQRRIQSELREWSRSPPDGCRLQSCEPLTEWVILMEGPETSAITGVRLYDGEVYRLKVSFSDQYPLDPPEFIFLPPSPEHVHIYSNGFICLDILYAGAGGGWSPAMTISSCCLSLRSMLASATRKERPPGDEQMSRRNLRSPKAVNWLFDDATV